MSTAESSPVRLRIPECGLDDEAFGALTLSRSRCRRTGHLARGVLVVDRCPEHGQRGVGGVAEAL